MDPGMLISVIGVIVTIVGVCISYKQLNKNDSPTDPPTEQISINVQPAQAHLLSANWTPLIDLIEDKLKGVEAGYTIRLDIPLLKHHFDDYEEDIRKLSDAEQEILHTIKRNLKNVRRDAESILDNLFWITEQMIETGYNRRQISVVCDRIVSFAVNKILGKLGIEDYPRIEYLKEFVAFTLGYNRKDLLCLEFGTSDGRVVRAEVPIDFLLNTETLVSLGEKLESEYGVKTLRDKVINACMSYHELDDVFGSQKEELWIQFVLPLSVVRYSREGVIIRLSSVKRCGLA